MKKNELIFLSERDRYNLIVVYPYLYLNTNEKETYDLFRSGNSSFGIWKEDWDKTSTYESWYESGQFNPGHRQFEIHCYSIEDTCFLYMQFLKEGFECRVETDGRGIGIGNKSIERTYMTRDEVIKESQKYNCGIADSLCNDITQRWLVVQVLKKDFEKFRNIIKRLEIESGYSNVWLDETGFTNFDFYKGSKFIIK